MGNNCILKSASGRSSSGSSSSSRGGCSRSIIKVVHLDGWLEEFDEERVVTVGEVTSKVQNNKAKHFVFKQNSTELLIESPPKPMEATAKLEPGNIYFLLPHTIFQMEMSPMDLLTISKRLSTIAANYAKSATTAAAAAAAAVHDDDDTKQQQQQQQQTKTMAKLIKSNRYAHCSSSSSRRYVSSGGGGSAGVDITNNNNINYNYASSLVRKNIKKQVEEVVGSDQSSSSNTTWKPILESIKET